jgi:hypothetical protein
MTAMPGHEERTLSRIMMDASVDFATCPHPSHCKIGGGSHSPLWPLYSSGPRGSYIVLDAPINRMEIKPDDYRDEYCAFFENIVYPRIKNITGFYPAATVDVDLNVKSPGPMDAVLKLISQQIDLD